MSTISPYSSAFYQMPGQSSSSGADSLASSGIDSLAQILSNNASATVSGSDLDQLDLSPQALSILNGTATVTGASSSDPLLAALDGNTDNADNTGIGSSSNFTLTNSQQQQISTILEKYANAPFTQATFNQIQSDLQAAGLSSNQLSLQDQVNSFNPTSVFLNALSGNQTNNSLNSLDPTDTAATEQTKSSNYMNQIYQEWQGISTTANSASTTVNSTTAVTPTGNA